MQVSNFVNFACYDARWLGAKLYDRFAISANFATPIPIRADSKAGNVNRVKKPRFLFLCKRFGATAFHAAATPTPASCARRMKESSSAGPMPGIVRVEKKPPVIRAGYVPGAYVVIGGLLSW